MSLDARTLELEKEWRRFVPGAEAALCLRRPDREPIEPEASFWQAISPAQRERGALLSEPGRRKQWIAARRCELELESRLGGGVLTSVSHSSAKDEAWCLGLGLASQTSAGMLGVGVDLEASARAASLSSRLVERVVDREEARLPLEPLELWVIKEACFKADPGNSGRVVWEYRALSYDPATGLGRAKVPRIGLLPEREGRFQLLRVEGWLIAWAVVRVVFDS